eukprot:10240547-Lingulodinium_polyedra.AAC.1
MCTRASLRPRASGNHRIIRSFAMDLLSHNYPLSVTPAKGAAIGAPPTAVVPPSVPTLTRLD